MRWLEYAPKNVEGLAPILPEKTLSELYDIQTDIENKLKELRLKEPSAKRKYERDHKIWYDECQGYIEDLKEIRDLICQKKNESRE